MEVADTVLVTLMPDSGDAIQALKAGIMEIADIYLVNKADREGADQLATAITTTLQLADSHSPWIPPVLLTSAQSGQGIEELWDKVQDHRGFMTDTSELTKRRGMQRRREFLETVEEEMARRLTALVEEDPALLATLDKVAMKEAEPYSSAMEFLGSASQKSDGYTFLWPKRD